MFCLAPVLWGYSTNNISLNEDAAAGVRRVNWIHRLLCSDSEPVFAATRCPVNKPGFTNSADIL
jgi:hypothetical protein